MIGIKSFALLLWSELSTGATIKPWSSVVKFNTDLEEVGLFIACPRLTAESTFRIHTEGLDNSLLEYEESLKLGDCLQLG